MVAAAHAAAPAAPAAPVAIGGKETDRVGEDLDGEHRKGKLFSVFQIVQFKNDDCSTVDGNTGQCFTASECTAKGGDERGSCASGFGVCCFFEVDSCGTNKVTKAKTGVIKNANSPGPVSGDAAVCPSGTMRQARQSTSGLFIEYTLQKFSSDIQQMRFDFELGSISKPMMGNCDNDTITFTGADAVTMKTIPMNLCGVLTGQHVFVSVKEVEEIKLTITLTSIADQFWKIKFKQIDSSETDELAPRGCLQYFQDEIGTLETFNFDSGNGELLNDHKYNMCIEQKDAYCDIALQTDPSMGEFMLGGSAGACSDSVIFGTSQYCGSTFGNSGQLNWNYTGSYNVPFMSDSDNAAMDGGFKISYVLLPC